jgi:cytochrome c oxidase accessory protein FixG
MLGTTALVFIDFAYFREQTCLVACPYGRLQSVLLDRRSTIVAYDARRGEPRGRVTTAGAGDCVDCGLCVQTCPTGIDIRQGLQMECIHCTQCMDACDAVMARLKRPAGLIRYGSRDELEGRSSSRLRPRVVLYPIALVVSLGLFAWGLGTRAQAEVTLLGPHGAPYVVEDDGSVVSQVRVKIANRGNAARRYSIALEGAPDARLVAPENPMSVAAGAVGQTSVFVVSSGESFEHGERAAEFRIGDGEGFERVIPYRLVGPDGEGEGDE